MDEYFSVLFMFVWLIRWQISCSLLLCLLSGGSKMQRQTTQEKTLSGETKTFINKQNKQPQCCYAEGQEEQKKITRNRTTDRWGNEKGEYEQGYVISKWMQLVNNGHVSDEEQETEPTKWKQCQMTAENNT